MRGRIAEDRDERCLVVELGVGRERDDQRGDRVQQRCPEEAEPDGAAGGGVAVDLGEDVAEDVGDWEEHHRAPRSRRREGGRIGPMRMIFCATRFETSRMTTKAVVRASR